MASGKEIVYPELSDDLKSGLGWSSLKYFGAGAIMASVTIGSGETLFASRAGAMFGYSLMWAFVLSAIMKGIQVYTGARHMVLTGEHPMTHWGKMPGPKNWVPLTIGILSLICFPFWLAALPQMIGTVINWVTGFDAQVLGMPSAVAKAQLADLKVADPAAFKALSAKVTELDQWTRVWASIAIVFAVTLTWFQTYALLERIQLVLVGFLLICILVATFACNPDWMAALMGMMPSVPAYPEWVRTDYTSIVSDTNEWAQLGLCLGAIGGGTYDYLGYIGCFREKGWGAMGLGHHEVKDEDVQQAGTLPIATDEKNIARGRKWLLPAQMDVGVGFFCVLIFTICFVTLGAEILHTSQAVPDKFELLSKQSAFLTQMHPSLLYVYQIGIFVAFLGTIYGAYEIYIRTAYECLAPISTKLRHMPERKFRAWILLYCGVGGMALNWLYPGNPSSLVAPAAILGGVFTCGLWCLAMVWTDRKFLPRALQMRPFLLSLTVISGITLTGLGAWSLWEYIAKLTGLGTWSLWQYIAKLIG